MAPTPPPGWDEIPCVHQREAQEHSFVLETQGITALPREQDGAWGLWLRSEDHGRALSVLAAYRAENARRPWERELPRVGWIFHLGAFLWAAWLIAVFTVSSQPHDLARVAGSLDASRVLQGEWWRLFTAMSLHADLKHLAANLTTGLVVFGLVMARFGAGLGLLGGLLAGLTGNLFTMAWHGELHRNVGASGMIMGAVGLLAVDSWVIWRQGHVPWRRVLAAFGAGCGLFLLWGLDPESDVAAHAGGFFGGIGWGFGIGWMAPDHETRLRASPLAGLACVLAVLLTWGLAMR
jgi:membrane associated rhomboid family serine protease